MFMRWVLMLLAVAGLAACSADRAPDAADAAVADPASAAAQADAAREPDEYEDDDVLLSQHPVPHVVVKEAFITAATPEDNIDSPASWLQDGKRMLVATANRGPCGLGRMIFSS